MRLPTSKGTGSPVSSCISGYSEAHGAAGGGGGGGGHAQACSLQVPQFQAAQHPCQVLKVSHQPPLTTMLCGRCTEWL